jgi:hypothetical protein
MAQQIALAFGVAIDKDVVRRILSLHYRPDSSSQGPKPAKSVALFSPILRAGSVMFLT